MGKHSHSDSRKPSSARLGASELALEDARPVRSRTARADVVDVVATRQKHRGRKIALIVFAVLFTLVAVVGVWAWAFINSVNGEMAHGDPKVLKALTPVSQAKKSVVAPAPAPFTMLLLGTDNRGVAGDSRTDTILFARFDPAKKKVWILSLPRDTRVEIPGHGHAKLNKAYTFGGAALTIDTVENLLGVPVNHYMEVNINGFKRIVEVLGGVWVDVDTEIDDPKAAAANPGREGRHIEPGYQRLTPAEALVYVRSRDFPDADFARMRHQQEFFKAVAKQSTQFTNVFKIPALVRETSRFTKTDFSVGQLVKLARQMRGMSDDGMDTATLLGEWRSPYVYTDENVKADLLARMMAGRSFEESTVVGTTVPSDISVTVRNGSGVAGVATQAGTALTDRGFDVREIGNAKRSDYAQTLVIYNDKASDAESVVSELGQGKATESAGEYEFATDVLVVVGRDWKPAASVEAEPQ